MGIEFTYSLNFTSATKTCDLSFFNIFKLSIFLKGGHFWKLRNGGKQSGTESDVVDCTIKEYNIIYYLVQFFRNFSLIL